MIVMSCNVLLTFSSDLYLKKNKKTNNVKKTYVTDRFQNHFVILMLSQCLRSLQKSAD